MPHSWGGALFGNGIMLSYALEELGQDGYDFSYLVDDTKSLQGKVVSGLKVISREQAERLGINNMIITITHVAEVQKSFESKDVNMISFGAYNVCKHYKEYVDVRDNYLEDEKSKLVFNVSMYSQLTEYFSCDFQKFLYEKNQYFALPQFSLLKHEHIVDCGAYVGDTLEQFLINTRTMFLKYYAFEPGSWQYEALKKRTARIEAEWGLKEGTIIIENAGIGAEDFYTSESVVDLNAGTGYRLEKTCGTNSEDKEDTSEKIVVRSIDSYFAEKKVTFIKADIEGFEYDLLIGARKIISEQKPKIAICAYHLPCDLYRLAIKIKELNPAYRFAMRHHCTDYEETVLYCW